MLNHNSEDESESLINKWEDINSKDMNYYMMNSYFLTIIIYLKERNYSNNNNMPIHIAVEQNSVQRLELLLSKGADINAKNFLSSMMNSLILIIIISFTKRKINN